MRKRKIEHTPEQADRQRRFDAALIRAGLTCQQYSDEYGFVAETIWRWVQQGDHKAPAVTGKSTTSWTLAEAFDIDAGYLQVGGPTLWASDVKPYTPQPATDPVDRASFRVATHVLFWFGPTGQARTDYSSRVRAEFDGREIVRGGPTGTRARVLREGEIIAEWYKAENGACKRVWSNKDEETDDA